MQDTRNLCGLYSICALKIKLIENKVQTLNELTMDSNQLDVCPVK